jgi:hypothetical protein
MATPVLKAEMALKVMKILNPRKENDSTILEYKKIENADEKKIFPEELTLLILKYKLLKMKVGERVPLISRVEDHKWFITKDKYGIIYFILAHKVFEEKFVFKMQAKVQGLIDYYYYELQGNDEKMAEEAREKIEEVVDQFNNALSRNAQADILISSDYSKHEIVSVEPPILDINNPVDQLQESVDKNDIFYLMDQRNSRLFNMQIVVLVCLFLTLILGVLDLMSMMKPEGKLLK